METSSQIYEDEMDHTLDNDEVSQFRNTRDHQYYAGQDVDVSV